MENDTIAAIATAAGMSGIGIIRISGENAIPIIDEIFRNGEGKSLHLCFAVSHTVHYGYIYDGNEVVDEVLVTLMRSPRSYTTEDTVEINCHGGTFILQRVLSLVLKHGARPADPGEFTKRAFLNGRIDLTEAESVMDLIASKNEFARKNSLSILRGSVYRQISEIRDLILHETAFIEAALDDPEHYSLDDYLPKLSEKTGDFIKAMDKLLSNAQNGRILKEGIQTCLIGRPNVGKSSLLNALSGEERAIVTEIAGTTRDAIDMDIRLGDLFLHIIDTAGIRHTEDRVEKIGVQKTLNIVEEADLILFLLDASEELTDEDKEIFSLIEDKKAIILLNKNDLPPVLDKERVFPLTSSPVISISAIREEGLSELKEKIQDLFFHGEISFNDQIYITNERQLGLLRKARQSLELVDQGIRGGVSEEFLTVDLMDCYSFLGEIIGEETGDDLADRIFSDFCMGK
ncbi:MAG: tRNA uridine-5-carboxymethylaminomethyl(34) synthesis GTPase MnmE [Lachnospiraceae bacterium]|nr:tRNA uridine-5-carboxymethylaminomethyl(34) synthesis GTPase MnmE [Lachnospiraceae bacterium]